MRFNRGFCLSNFFLLLILLCVFVQWRVKLHCSREQLSHSPLFQPLFRSVRVRSKAKCIEPGPTQLKKIIFIFFNCVLFKKTRRRSLDYVAFAEFDRNPNFVLARSDPVKKIQFLFLFLIVFYSKN